MNRAILQAHAIAALKLPLQATAVFTGAKSFRDNPIIGSRLLNRLGLHVVRILLAAAVTRFRLFCLRSFATVEQRRAFVKDGYLLIENYLPADQFEALNAEARRVSGQVRQCIQGDTLTQRVLLNDDVLDANPSCNSALKNSGLNRLLKFAAARNTTPIYYLQSIKSNVVDAPADPQRTLHSDTFHATMKAWLYLDDVSDHNGPLNFVPGSQRITWKRLLWEYRQSIGEAQENSYASRGSLRIDKSELQSLGLSQPIAFRVPANTLVVANTNGFHCRGAAIGGPASRLELWAYSRTNPFNPFPGFDFAWYRKLSHSVINKYLQRQDKIAADKGMNASWHIVPESDFHRTYNSTETRQAQKNRASAVE